MFEKAFEEDSSSYKKQAVRIPTERSCEHLLHSRYVIRNGMRMVAEIPYLVY